MFLPDIPPSSVPGPTIMATGSSEMLWPVGPKTPLTKIPFDQIFANSRPISVLPAHSQG